MPKFIVKNSLIEPKEKPIEAELKIENGYLHCYFNNVLVWWINNEGEMLMQFGCRVPLKDSGLQFTYNGELLTI